MISRLLLASLLLTYIACQEAPKDKLPVEQSKAVAILADVHLAKEVAKYYGQEVDSILPIYMDSILKIHKIDSSQYVSMMDYLEQNVREYHELEQKVHDQLKIYQSAREVDKIDD